MRVQADGQHGAQERKAARPSSNHGKAEAMTGRAARGPKLPGTHASSTMDLRSCCAVLCHAVRAGSPESALCTKVLLLVPSFTPNMLLQQKFTCAWADDQPKCTFSNVLCVQAGLPGILLSLL